MKKILSDRDSMQLIESMVRLSGDSDYQRVLGWYAMSLMEKREENDFAVDLPGNPQLSWNQGMCQCLTEILQTNNDAQHILRKMQEGAKRNEQ